MSIQNEVVPIAQLDTEKGDIAHVENPEYKKTDAFREEAILAENIQRDLPLWEALKTYRAATLWSAALSLCIIMDGYDTGLISTIIGLGAFREKYGYYAGATKGYQLSAAWQTVITNASFIGNIIGITLSSWFQDRYGYRRTLQISLVLLTGFLFIVFYAPSPAVMFVGQLLCGMPWGTFASSSVSYASDVTPICLRQYLTTYVNLCWVIGQFLSAGVLQGVSKRTGIWAYRIPFAIQWIWPIPLFILVTLAPESPWFLVRAGRLEEAERSVSRLAAKDERTDPSQIVAMMVRTNKLELEHQPGTTYWDCFKGVELRRTEIACVAWACQILAGNTFANSPVYFFEQAGLSSSNAFALGLGSKAIAFVGTCGSWVTLTYMGRRPVFVAGMGVMAVLLFIVGGLGVRSSSGTGASWGMSAMIVLWIFVYDFTVGPVAYVVVGEVSSTRLRSKSVGLARNSFNILRIAGGVIYTYQVNPTAWDWKGKAGFFWGGASLLGCIWAYFRLPECRGRSFRELDILFERRVPAREFKNTYVAPEDED